MPFYKATATDGVSFRRDPHGVDYASACGTGTLIVHPEYATMVPNEPATYLSISTEPAETLIGGAWPCRLFEVEPHGPVLEKLSVSPHKRACLSLTVVRELPAHLALGPNGARVAALIERARTLTSDELDHLAAAWDAAWDAAWAAARDAARAAAWAAARDAAWAAARDAARAAARDAARAAARDAARDAAVALLTQDLITDSQFETLAGPWINTIGLDDILAIEV